MTNVTKHARERWTERVNPKSNEDAEEQIRKAFNVSVHICDDSQDSNKQYYINNEHWIFVYNKKDDTIITVYEVDFGFYKGLNKKIAVDLLERLEYISNKIAKLDEQQQFDKGTIMTNINLMRAENEVLQEKINCNNTRIKENEAVLTSFEAEKKVFKKEYDQIAMQLTKSIAVKSDMIKFTMQYNKEED